MVRRKWCTGLYSQWSTWQKEREREERGREGEPDIQKPVMIYLHSQYLLLIWKLTRGPEMNYEGG